jgi:hypothetical protein
MAADSDEQLKRELIDEMGAEIVSNSGKEIYLRIFPDGSNEDQLAWSVGGLTFQHGTLSFGSNDAAYYVLKDGVEIPIMALELTDALNRGSSGNAQYQRFHHALGAVRNGVIGVYYLKKGLKPVQPDLYKMALSAWKIHETPYIISQDLAEIKTLLELWGCGREFEEQLELIRYNMQAIHDEAFARRYNSDWSIFANKRSTVIQDNCIIKHSGRWIKNFTDGSQRAGHIAVGEMYLSSYLFPHHHLYYLWPKMTADEVKHLNRTKANDKEWSLLSGESRVTIVTRDNIRNLPREVVRDLEAVSHLPGKGEALKTYNRCVKFIVSGLRDGSLSIF